VFGGGIAMNALCVIGSDGRGKGLVFVGRDVVRMGSPAHRE